MKKNIDEIIGKYTAGEVSLEEANIALKDADCGLQLDPQKNVLTEEEKRATTVGYYPEQANGWGLMNTGTGSPDKVQVKNGKLLFAVNSVNEDGTVNMKATVSIAGHIYQVKGDMLTA